jgi:hypothetical protein
MPRTILVVTLLPLFGIFGCSSHDTPLGEDGSKLGPGGGASGAGGGGAGGAGGSSDPFWGCLDQPAPAAPGPGPFNVTLHLQNIAESNPVAGAEVTLCRKLDTTCESPEGASSTDASGEVTFQVPRGFDGYVQTVKIDPSLDPQQQLVPSYYYFNPGVDSDLRVTLNAMTGALLLQLAFLVEAPQMADRGLILVNALNCRLEPAVGVAFSTDPADTLSTLFYVVGGVPDTSSGATGPDGFAGFANINAGNVAVTGEIAETGREIDSVAFHVRPSSLTQTRLVARGQ